MRMCGLRNSEKVIIILFYRMLAISSVNLTTDIIEFRMAVNDSIV